MTHNRENPDILISGLFHILYKGVWISYAEFLTAFLVVGKIVKFFFNYAPVAAGGINCKAHQLAAAHT